MWKDLLGIQSDSHDDGVEDVADRFADSPLFTDVRADHISEYPDTPIRNGRRVDVEADSVFGGTVGVEVETDPTSRDREQQRDLLEYDRRNENYEFETLDLDEPLRL